MQKFTYRKVHRLQILLSELLGSEHPAGYVRVCFNWGAQGGET